ncbi:hypothetical protein CCAND95_130051 [Capnocytophaga canis]|uniref:Uncharacterized protein n=1 Tax=Capnocytophaga canis TaxID=1848903 RepID=A0A0B7HVU0_9FLAO|nr:NVEALA domain-containing protein [Capnocytophaga canis]CEN42684.1 hypothetical protein CCAND95_130051 [Capnocytophaga canis]CEN46773.1 hypothetical protein CCAND38_370087 [Capnocytophaga canis]
MKSLLVIGIVATDGYGINQSINKDTTELNELTLANLEALADGENGGAGTRYKICYNESVVKVGFTYYDCSNCKIKVYDEKGRGRVSKCFY